MGEVIEGGTYLKIKGQTIKAGTMIYGFSSNTWQTIPAYVTIPYDNTDFPMGILTIGTPFNLLQFFIDYYEGYENLPRESVKIGYDTQGDPSTADNPYFAFGYDYDASTHKALFYGGFGVTSGHDSVMHGYSLLGYAGCNLDDNPTSTDIMLSNLYFFKPQEEQLPDLTRGIMPFGFGFRTIMNGQLYARYQNLPGLIVSEGISGLNQYYNFHAASMIYARDTYLDIVGYAPNGFTEQQWQYYVYSGGTYTGGLMYCDVPPKLIEEEKPEDVHYGDDPAPVGVGGNGQYIYDPDDLNGSLDALPTNGALESGFVHLYAPTTPQLQALSNYLWTTDFWEQVAKLLKDPMDAIINLMRVPIDLSDYRGTAVNCVCGNKDTGVAMAPLDQSFIELDFGYIELAEKWGSALDYNPFTVIECYLPYCGFIKLDTNDIFEMISWGYSRLELKYIVNCFTGECVARISMSKHKGYARERYRYLIGQYAGNLGMNIPVTASNYSQFFSNLFNAGISAAGAAATGGASAGISAAASITNALTSAAAGGNPQIQRAGNFSGGSSPMEYHNPFIMIDTPIQVLDVNGYAVTAGLPTSCYRKISEASGFCKIEAVELNGFSGTADEARELENILKGGIVV